MLGEVRFMRVWVGTEGDFGLTPWAADERTPVGAAGAGCRLDSAFPEGGPNCGSTGIRSEHCLNFPSGSA